jgi:hypothetical protein
MWVFGPNAILGLDARIHSRDVPELRDIWQRERIWRWWYREDKLDWWIMCRGGTICWASCMLNQNGLFLTYLLYSHFIKVNFPQPHCLTRQFNISDEVMTNWTKSLVDEIMGYPDYLNFWNSTERRWCSSLSVSSITDMVASSPPPW